MSLKPAVPAAVAKGSAVPLAWVVGAILVAAGVAAVATVTISRSAAGPGGPLTLVDDARRTVHLQPDPNRVVALGPNIVDILFRLGLRSHLVGVDCYNGTDSGALASDYTPEQIATWNLSPAMCVEADPFVDATLANLQPDIVLASTIVPTSQMEQITGELDVPLVVVQASSPVGILLDDLLVGEIFGVSATPLNAALTGVLANASVVVGAAVSFPSVLVTYSTDPSGYWTYGAGSFGQALVELAGGTSISGSVPYPYPELSAAQVLAAQPEWIFYAVGFGLTLSSYQGAPDWTSLTAVQNGNLSGLDSTWLTEAGPTMILDGVPALLAVLHPQVG